MTSNEIKESLERLLHGTSKDLSAYLLEVCSSETVQDTKTDLHVHMLRLDGNNRPRINDFANFVTDCVINYCIPPSEIREAKELDEANHTTTHFVKLYKKAAGLFTDLKNTGEGGEMLLSIMVQRILGIPQLLCKMPLKTNPNFDFWALTDGDAFVGFMVVQTYKNLAYLFFLAIDSSCRAKGYGSRAIETLRELYPDKKQVVDFEMLDEAAPNNIQRINRRQFYLKNGYKETVLFLSYLGVDYEVFCMSDDFDTREFKDMMKEIRVEGFEPKYFCK